MSVFTKVTQEELSAWLDRYPVGKLLDFQGIAAGIENTNYFVTTTGGRYVLTLFEKLRFEELPFYLNLMSHLARHGIPCPAPVADRDQALLGALKNKPATLVTRLPGAPVSNPAADHCARVGAMLAELHLAGSSYHGVLDNPRGAAWRSETAPQVIPFLDARRRALLESELAFQATQDFGGLPRGPVHGDLFRDNVLFDGRPGFVEIGGVIDFYFAGVDAFLFDVAVTANDWCADATGKLIPERLDAFLAAYRGRRAFSAEERAAWPAMLRAAALRFWLSRLYDFYLPRPGELTHAHDPEHYRRVIELRRDAAVPLP